MQSYRSVGYKSPMVKGIFLLVSVFLLISVNFLLFTFSFVWFLLFVISGLLRWGMMRVLTRVYYAFNEEAIIIHLPNKKTLSLNKKDIDTVARYD
jgi:ABC-type bacteriocin/lantibiotic exporter with double-glycine peptidase domain